MVRDARAVRDAQAAGLSALSIDVCMRRAVVLGPSVAKRRGPFSGHSWATGTEDKSLKG